MRGDGVPDQELTRKEEDAARGRPRPTDATESWGSSPGICHEEVPSDQEIWPAPPESPDAQIPCAHQSVQRHLCRLLKGIALTS
jgi:hypothetical protein